MPLKMRYNCGMEEVKESNLAEIIGKNIMRLRKMMNMTQLELAEKLGYSDKSVSKWEQGNGIPDVRTLVQLSEFFGVSMDDLIHEHVEKPVMPQRTKHVRHLIIMLLSVGLCWLVAVVAYAFGLIIGKAVSGNYVNVWLAFPYALLASAIVTLVFSCVWKYRITRVISVSVLIWTAIACVYLTVLVLGPNIWPIFFIGIPLQILALIFFVWWRRTARFK